jgi:hypothetical protein
MDWVRRTLRGLSWRGAAIAAAISIGLTACEDAIAPPPAANYALTGSSSAAVGSSIPLAAQLVDANGNVVRDAGRNVSWTSSGGGSFDVATSTTNADGIATTTFTAATTPGDVTITATDETGITGSFGVSVVVGPATKLVFVNQPSDAGWRVVMRPAVAVAVQDQYSNTVTSSSEAISLSLEANPGGATLLGGGPVTPINGIATFPGILLDQPASGYTLRATSASTTTAAATSSSFSVSSTGIVAGIPADWTGAPRNMAGLAVNGSTIAFGTGFVTGLGSVGSTLWLVPTTGGTPTQAVPVSSNTGFSFGLSAGRTLADGDFFDVITGVSVARGSVTGANYVWYELHLNSGFPRDLESDGTYFYISYGTQHTDAGREVGVLRVRISDGSITKLYAQRLELVRLYPPGIALADGYLYYTAYDRTGTGTIQTAPPVIAIERVPIDSGAPMVVTSAAPKEKLPSISKNV